jgi:hypothetical protein
VLGPQRIETVREPGRGTAGSRDMTSVVRETSSEAAPALFSTGAAPAQRPAPMAPAMHTPTVNTPIVLDSFSMGDRSFIEGDEMTDTDAESTYDEGSDEGSATDTDAESTYDEGSDEGSTTSENDAWSAASTEQVTAEWDEEESEEDVPTTSNDEEEEQEDDDDEDYQSHLEWMARTVHLQAPSCSFVPASVPEDPFQSRPWPAWLCSSRSTSPTRASHGAQELQFLAPAGGRVRHQTIHGEQSRILSCHTCCKCKIPRGHDANKCSVGVELNDNSFGMPSTDWRCCCCYWDYAGTKGDFGRDNFNQHACSPCKIRRETLEGGHDSERSPSRST